MTNLFSHFLTPRLVGIGLTGEIVLLVALYLPASLGLTTRFRLTEAIVMTVSGVIAFGIATALSLAAAAEYRQSRWARLAWQMLAANAAISLIKRSVIGSPLLDFAADNYRTGPLRGLLDNMLVVPANLCLLIGIIAMWWAFQKIGIGFRVQRRDHFAMAAVALLFLTLLIFRANLSQGQSPYQLSRVLQPLGLALLGVVSAFGVVLHRYAMQMGDGRMAAVMRWLMVYVLLRGGLVLLQSGLNPALPLLFDSTSELEGWAFDLMWQIVPWTAALAATCRAQLTARAAEQLRRLRAA